MVPFVRSVAEARQVTALLAQNGLQRGEHGLKVIMMCELPTNALLAEQYLEHFDGMSIGSNDMTQLTLGLDRDSAIMARHFDERDEAVRKLLSMAISACANTASTSASAARVRRITPTWRAGCSIRASRACRSTPIQWWRPGCSSRSALKAAWAPELQGTPAYAGANRRAR